MRSFKIVAQAKELWNIFIEKKTVFVLLRFSDFGFEETDKIEDVNNNNKFKNSKIGQVIVNSKIIKIDSISKEFAIDKISKSKFKKTERKSLTSVEIQYFIVENNIAEETAQKTTISSATPTEKQYRLFLYRFNLDVWKQSKKKIYQTIVLLVYWINSTIQEQL